MQRRRARGYLILVALMVLFIMTVLSLALVYTGQQGDLVYRQERTHNQQESLLDDTVDRLGALLAGVSTPGDTLSLDGNLHVTGEGGAWLRAGWGGDSGSRTRGAPTGYNTSDNLFGDDPGDGLPAVGYDASATQTALDSLQVPSSQTLVEFQGPLMNYRAAYSASFPYGLYAPGGSVVADSVQAWANPLFTQTGKTPPDLALTGVPVLVRAKGSILVGEQYPVGFAYSDEGPIRVSGGAVGFTRKQPADTFAPALTDAVDTAFEQLSDGMVDKTDFLIGHTVDIVSLFQFVTGKQNVVGTFSVQQAMMMPFPPIPKIVSEPPLMIGLVIVNPFPPDTSSSSVSDDFAQQLKALDDQIATLQEDIQKHTPAKSPDDSAAIAADQQKIDLLQGQLQAMRQQAQDQQDIVGSKILTNVPMNADQEGTFVTTGWSYAWIVAYLGTVIKDCFAGNFEGMYEQLYRPTRVVHLANTIPDWYFPDGLPETSDGYARDPSAQVRKGYLSMEAVWTVPPGRTAMIRGDTQIRGALWVQRGASMYVAGNFVISPADDWYSSDPGTAVPITDPLYPDGRIYLEEGATLLVDGDLTVEGGTPAAGSVLVGSPIGAIRPINSAILCKGSVSLTYGVHPGVTMEDLFESVMDSNEAAAKMRKFLHVFLRDVAPNIAKLIGPFEERTCWFAEFATTIEMFPLIPIFGDVPLPIPLPYPNCMRETFETLSDWYAVELNLFLGENLYPMSLWWPFDNGGVPMFPKVDPAALAGPLASIPTAKELASWDSLEPQLLGYLTDVWSFTERYLKSWFFQAIVAMAEQNLIPFEIAPCPPMFGSADDSGDGKSGDGKSGDGESGDGKSGEGGSGGDGGDVPDTPAPGPGYKWDPPGYVWNDDTNEFESLPGKWVRDPEAGEGEGTSPGSGTEEGKPQDSESNPVNQAAEDWLQEALDWGIWDFKYYFGQLLAATRSGIETAAEASVGFAEAPGLFVYAGGDLQVGASARLASGFFVAGGDVSILAQRTAGAVVSTGGNVTVGDLYYYPWFTRACLYVPQKPANFDVKVPTDTLRETLQFTVPNSSVPPLDLGRDWFRVTAQGGSR